MIHCGEYITALHVSNVNSTVGSNETDAINVRTLRAV